MKSVRSVTFVVPPRRCQVRLAQCAACLLACLLGDWAFAQDRVVIRGSTGGRVTLTGVIEDYTGREITIRGQATATKRYPAASVIEVETLQQPAHVQGLKRLDEGQVEAGVKELESALKQENRVWVRREILATLVRAGVRMGDLLRAGSRFLVLVESDPETRYFSWIPLIWAPRERLPDATREQAREWLLDDFEVAQLIGASLLLDDSRTSGAALAALRKLASSTDDRIRYLSQAQSWRRQVAQGDLGELQVEQWRERVEAMPSELRAGPFYIVSRAYASRQEFELAAAAALWLPLVDDHDQPLTARATLDAAASLTRIGRDVESRSLLREVVRRFAGTPFAGEATELLQRGE